MSGRRPELARLRRLAAPAALCAILLIVGCAEQAILRGSRDAISRGDFETAIRGLETGVKDHPESSPLRSTLLQVRSEAMARLLSRVADLRSRGDLAQAEQELQRADRVDPGNARIQALVAEIRSARQQTTVLQEAEALLAKGQAESAIRRIGEGLKENPRHAGLQALRRRIEADARQATSASHEILLAESRPITLDFRDANLRSVLDVVSRASGVNFIIDRDVRAETRVTVYLRQARVEDALDLIVSTGQLAKKVVDSQTMIIFPDTPEKRRQYQDQVVRVFQLSSADAKGAAAFLKAMLGIREPFVDERSNMLALRDTPENIRLAERLIGIFDTGEPEVLLEVEVLEVSSSRLTELGIKFPDTFSLTPLPPNGETRLTLGNIPDLTRDNIAVGVAGLLINLRREVGDFTTLANPRIRVRNKEQAKVLVGDKIPVITTTTSSNGFVSDTVNYLDVGLKLDVEPAVYADNDVAIKIALEVSSLGAAVKTSSGTLAYQIGTRTASTLLRLRDGETQLLAGLISRDDRSSASRVPGVGDLPVLGRLFSNQLDGGNRKELVLAITPRILRGARQLDPSDAELWIGTEARQRLRPPPWMLPTSSPAAAPVPTDASRATHTLPGASDSQPAPVAKVMLKGPGEATVGQMLEVVVTLDSPAPLRGLPLEVRFDNKRVQFVDAVEGEFFRQSGAATSFSHGVDLAVGTVRIGVLRNQATGASGSGTVATLRFKVLEAGPANVALDSVTPVHLGGTRPKVEPPKPLVVNAR